MGTFCLIGYPLGHSMSAVMHNSNFRAMGLDHRFELREVRQDELEAFAEAIFRSPEVGGASVTIPHKVSIAKYLDELDPLTQQCGSVNTIVKNDGRLKGYNTDGVGAMRALKEAYGSLDGIRTVVIGAGGASRSICYHLSLIAERITITNRTPRNAENLVETLLSNPECRADLSAMPLSDLKEALSDADLLINTTPVGMHPHADSTPVEKELLGSHLFVFDAIYNPPKTRLLREAESVGAMTLNGVDMLVYQGSEAFRLWTGLNASEETMKQAVIKALMEV